MKRIYAAVCSWIESKAAPDDEPDEPEHDTQLDALVELGEPLVRPELRHGDPRHSIDDDFGARRTPRTRPVSLTWHGTRPRA